MDPMLLGETLSGSTDQQYFGYWMPVGGDRGVGGFQVFAFEGGDGVNVYVETKSSDTDDSNPNVSQIGGATTTASGMFKFDITGAKDLVRYVVEFTEAGTYLHLQFVPMTWAPN